MLRALLLLLGLLPPLLAAEPPHRPPTCSSRRPPHSPPTMPTPAGNAAPFKVSLGRRQGPWLPAQTLAARPRERAPANCGRLAAGQRPGRRQAGAVPPPSTLAARQHGWRPAAVADPRGAAIGAGPAAGGARSGLKQPIVLPTPLIVPQTRHKPRPPPPLGGPADLPARAAGPARRQHRRRRPYPPLGPPAACAARRFRFRPPPPSCCRSMPRS